SRCGDCKIVLLGRRLRCENCSSRNLTHEVFSNRGTVYTYTIQRYPPPPPFVARQPWAPRGVAWVDLHDGGPRILAPLDGDVKNIAIGAEVALQFHIGWTDAAGSDVVAFSCNLIEPVTVSQ
ncbi:MAG: OB-fold domain-containing protein, partial [Steroidobacteraceae bacterium]